MWYVANLSEEIGSSLEEVSIRNIEKLKSRQERNQLQGNGDNR